MLKSTGYLDIRLADPFALRKINLRLENNSAFLRGLSFSLSYFFLSSFFMFIRIEVVSGRK